MERKLLLAAAIAATSFASAQYTLEYTYVNGAVGSGGPNEFHMVELEALGHVYVFYHKADERVYINDLYHQPVTSIDLSAAPDVSFDPSGNDVLFTSQYLFDLDDGIEVMFVSQNGATCSASIVDEDGTIIQTFQDEGPWVILNVPQVQQPIYNTPLGTKLIMSNWATGEAKVYALPGTLHTGIVGPNERDFISAPVKVYPNPSASEVTVLLDFSRNLGEVIFDLTDIAGTVALRTTIAGPSQRIDISGLAAGEYHYHVLVDGVKVNTGKLLKM